MGFTKVLGFGLAAIALSGCVDTPGPAELGVPGILDRQRANCIDAVQAQTNSIDVAITGEAVAPGGQRDYTLLVGGSGEWSCVVSGAGVVSSVTFLGSDGSDLA